MVTSSRHSSVHLGMDTLARHRGLVTLVTVQSTWVWTPWPDIEAWPPHLVTVQSTWVWTPWPDMEAWPPHLVTVQSTWVWTPWPDIEAWPPHLVTITSSGEGNLVTLHGHHRSIQYSSIPQGLPDKRTQSALQGGT